MKRTRSREQLNIPVIDVFAGPGGLSEGFSAVRSESGEQAFTVALSVEKDAVACRTRRMRAIRRHLEKEGRLKPYYEFLRGERSRESFLALPSVREAAARTEVEVLNAELGVFDRDTLDARIRGALHGCEKWLLIGGPPCQAYSLAGRSRRAKDTSFEDDERHFLYREYLRILKEHAPPIFVMENVKGLLSSRHGGSPMFTRILRDLSRPRPDLAYDIRSVVSSNEGHGSSHNDFLIESENFGVPQSRHRVILLGVRSDLENLATPPLLRCTGLVTAEETLSDLPRIRSRLSQEADSRAAWLDALKAADGLVDGWGDPAEPAIRRAMAEAARQARWIDQEGEAFLPSGQDVGRRTGRLHSWLGTPGLGGVIQHESRPHMRSDLARYLFASVYAKLFGRTPKLDVWPSRLLPNHDSVRGNGSIPFKDRFRVQCAHAPATTVVSHIAKDGHYFIHYDPAQCRSLTVREAARLQTFPDDYLFEGNRTQQYVQVGNAVPPLLAAGIAKVVLGLMTAGSLPAGPARTASQLRKV